MPVHEDEKLFDRETSDRCLIFQWSKNSAPSRAARLCFCLLARRRCSCVCLSVTRGLGVTRYCIWASIGSPCFRALLSFRSAHCCCFGARMSAMYLLPWGPLYLFLGFS